MTLAMRPPCAHPHRAPAGGASGPAACSDGDKHTGIAPEKTRGARSAKGRLMAAEGARAQVCPGDLQAQVSVRRLLDRAVPLPASDLRRCFKAIVGSCLVASHNWPQEGAGLQQMGCH
ncbi:hypothetical protein NDU88_007982 [Pleurodeles waltl]|uniref:Uncharacterized protein n=1 Tax=Pleurodeles waltl TaxID=8319 RepID=A0AAV7U2U4_PLEWA|nr:hypothetical protein NDU88_007982 [Pleurodeles waltl]